MRGKALFSRDVQRSIRASQLAPRLSKQNIGENIEAILTIADDLQRRSEKFYAIEKCEFRVIALLISKIYESLRSALLLLSYGLLEDHMATLRRHLEAITVFVYVSGRGEFRDYMAESLKLNGKPVKRIAEVFKNCPFEFSTRMYEHFKMLSQSTHPKAAGIFALNLNGNRQEKIISEQVLDEYIEVGYFGGMARMHLLANNVVTEICDVYYASIEDRSDYNDKRLILMNKLFRMPDEISECYTVENLMIPLKELYNRFQKSTGLAREFQELPKQKRIEDFIEDDQIKMIMKEHPGLIYEIGGIFMQLRVYAGLGSSF